VQGDVSAFYVADTSPSVRLMQACPATLGVALTALHLHTFIYRAQHEYLIVVQHGEGRNGVIWPHSPKAAGPMLLSVRTAVVLLTAGIIGAAAAGITYVATKQPAQAAIAGLNAFAGATVWVNTVIPAKDDRSP
jgi:hypothetical protein